MSPYKKQQSIRMAQLFMSRDAGVRHVVQLCLQAERERQRLKFKLAVMVDEIRAQDRSQSQRTLTGAVKLYQQRKIQR